MMRGATGAGVRTTVRRSLSVVTLLAVGCQNSTSSSLPESIREKARSTVPLAVPRNGPSPAPASPASDTGAGAVPGTGAGGSTVQRFAVRPFEEWTSREVAAAALGRIGRPAVPRLVEALQSPDATLRQQAADTLARIGPAADEAVPALVQALRDDDPLVRKSAARALGQIGPAAAAAVPSLIEMLVEKEL